jgi:uracil DNA glycosylase
LVGSSFLLTRFDREPASNERLVFLLWGAHANREKLIDVSKHLGAEVGAPALSAHQASSAMAISTAAAKFLMQLG